MNIINGNSNIIDLKSIFLALISSTGNQLAPNDSASAIILSSPPENFEKINK